MRGKWKREIDIEAIRQDFEAGVPTADIAKKYGVSVSAVSGWSRKHQWKRLDEASKIIAATDPISKIIEDVIKSALKTTPELIGDLLVELKLFKHLYHRTVKVLIDNEEAPTLSELSKLSDIMKSLISCDLMVQAQKEKYSPIIESEEKKWTDTVIEIWNEKYGMIECNGHRDEKSSSIGRTTQPILLE